MSATRVESAQIPMGQNTRHAARYLVVFTELIKTTMETKMRTIFRTVSFIGLAVFALSALATAKQAAPPQAKLTKVEGTIQVNGTSAISGATVFSDSTITTAARSSAVVSLGKTGSG